MSEGSATYRPGGWVAVAGPAAWLLADVDPNSALAGELYEAVTSGASVDALASERLAQLASFALAGPGAQGELRVLVRGQASAAVTDADGEQTVTADGSGPWAEQRRAGVRRVVLGRGTESSTDDTPWRLRVGMAAADAVVVRLGGSYPEPGPLPMPEPGPVPMPEPGPVPMPEPGPVPMPEPGPVPMPEPGPVPMPEPGPVPMPEPGPGAPPPAPPPVPPLSPAFSAPPIEAFGPVPAAEAGVPDPIGSPGHQPVLTAGQSLVLGQEPWRSPAPEGVHHPVAGPELGEWGDPVLSRPTTSPEGVARPNDFTAAPYGEDDFHRPGGVIGAPTGVYRGDERPPVSNVIGARPPAPAPAPEDTASDPDVGPPAPPAPPAPANPLGWEPVQESIPAYDTLHPRPDATEGADPRAESTPNGARPDAAEGQGGSTGYGAAGLAVPPPPDSGWGAPPPPVVDGAWNAPAPPPADGGWNAPAAPAPAAAPMVSGQPEFAAPQFAPPSAPADSFYPPPPVVTGGPPVEPFAGAQPAAPEFAAPEFAAPEFAAPEPAPQAAQPPAPEPTPPTPEPAPVAQVSGPPMVAAVTCVYGHLSPPYATECRVCSAAISPQEPFQTQRPVLGVLNLSTGDVVTLDRDVVLGRAPSDPGAEPSDQPHLVRLNSADNDISRNHLRVHLDGWHVLVTDLDSTNGTVATLPGQQPLRLRPNDALAVVPGTVVSIADEVSFRYEVPA